MILEIKTPIKTRFSYASPLFIAEAGNEKKIDFHDGSQRYDISAKIIPDNSNCFISTVTDNSLIDEGIEIGDTLVFNESVDAKVDEFVALNFNDELIIEKYQPQKHSEEDVAGVLCHVIKDLV
jgi:SOS-response transcriptional repressor LexA